MSAIRSSATRNISISRTGSFPAASQNKLHLLARRIVVPHPRGGTIDVSAPLPPHMQQSLEPARLRRLALRPDRRGAGGGVADAAGRCLSDAHGRDAYWLIVMICLRCYAAVGRPWRMRRPTTSATPSCGRSRARSPSCRSPTAAEIQVAARQHRACDAAAAARVSPPQPARAGAAAARTSPQTGRCPAEPADDSASGPGGRETSAGPRRALRASGRRLWPGRRRPQRLYRRLHQSVSASSIHRGDVLRRKLAIVGVFRISLSWARLVALTIGAVTNGCAISQASAICAARPCGVRPRASSALRHRQAVARRDSPSPCRCATDFWRRRRRCGTCR